MRIPKKLSLTLGLLLAFGPVSTPNPLGGQTPDPVVHAILFFNPSCPHCHELISEHLIPLQNRYGSRLVILGMDTSQDWANNIYWEAMRYYELPQEDWVVPILIVSNQVLVGGNTVPERFPVIIEEGLAAGGIDLPDFPALITFLRAQDALDPRFPDRLITRPVPAEGEQRAPAPSDSVVSAEPPAADPVIPEEPAAGEDPPALPPANPTGAARVGDTAPPEGIIPGGDTVGAGESAERPASGRGEVGDTAIAETPTSARPRAQGAFGLAEAARELESQSMWDRFRMDRAGNTLAVLVLVGMLLSLVLRGYPPRIWGGGGEWPTWVIPALVLVGASVASYLSFIEVTQAEAACGPVGDCNTVNQSEYAVLFGVLPVGVLGLMGYGAILVLWVLKHAGQGQSSRRATLGLWAAAFLGTIFSAYLTFLEPFVIGATCVWCLGSAVVMTLLLWGISPMAARVWPSGNSAPLSG